MCTLDLLHTKESWHSFEFFLAPLECCWEFEFNRSSDWIINRAFKDWTSNVSLLTLLDDARYSIMFLSHSFFFVMHPCCGASCTPFDQLVCCLKLSNLALWSIDFFVTLPHGFKQGLLYDSKPLLLHSYFQIRQRTEVAFCKIVVCSYQYSSNPVDHYYIWQWLVRDHQTIQLCGTLHLINVIGSVLLYVFLHLVKCGMALIASWLTVKIQNLAFWVLI